MNGVLTDGFEEARGFRPTGLATRVFRTREKKIIFSDWICGTVLPHIQSERGIQDGMGYRSLGRRRCTEMMDRIVWQDNGERVQR
jgi:hypothetical protein